MKFRAFVALAVIFATIAFAPVVIMSLWGWFVVPLGVAAIGYWHALGFKILATIVVKGISETKSRKELIAGDDWLENLLSVPVTYLFVWGLGWLISLGVLA